MENKLFFTANFEKIKIRMFIIIKEIYQYFINSFLQDSITTSEIHEVNFRICIGMFFYIYEN